MNNLLDALIAAKLAGGGGGEVTPASIVTATGQMDGTQKETTRNNLGAEPQKFVVTVTESGGVYSADKTFAEIAAAYEAGKTIEVYYNDIKYYLSYPGFVDDEIEFVGVELPDRIGMFTVVPSMWNYTSQTLQHATNELSVYGTTPTVTPVANNIYKCGTLTSLTVSSPPATGAYSIVFTSGATATTTTIPATILGLEDFSAEANTIYEINVLDNRAVVGSWAVSST